MPDEPLVRVLSEIQRRGAIGRGSIHEAIEHAEQYVACIPSSATTLIDLGSGGGLPGLVIAVRRPDLDVLLVERRAKRVDLLRYGVHALQVAPRVQVWSGDAADLVVDHPDPVDVVTARSFGPVADVLGLAHGMLRPGGRCVVSTPPGGVAAATVAGFVDMGQHGAVHVWCRH